MSLKISILLIVLSQVFAQQIMQQRATIQPYRNLSTEISVLSDNPYDDIRAYLGQNSIEVPEQTHNVRHIKYVTDPDLKRQVFGFTLHVNIDDDRGIKKDRQRTEIKVSPNGPEWMKGRKGSKYIYTWKFKIDKNFKYSNQFTILHQIKGDVEDTLPLVGLYATKNMRLKIKDDYHTSTPITEFQGHWIHAEEHITYGDSGSISIKLTRAADGKVLTNFSGNFSNFFIGSYMRPKWGFYRSLASKDELRDETVYFTDIKIEKV